MFYVFRIGQNRYTLKNTFDMIKSLMQNRTSVAGVVKPMFTKGCIKLLCISPEWACRDQLVLAVVARWYSATRSSSCTQRQAHNTLRWLDPAEIGLSRPHSRGGILRPNACGSVMIRHADRTVIITLTTNRFLRIGKWGNIKSGTHVGVF